MNKAVFSLVDLFMDRLSVVIPCYKKEKVVYSALSDIHSELCKLNRKFEMILVDDGSPLYATWMTCSS